MAIEEVKEIVRYRDYLNATNNCDEEFSKEDLMLVLFWGWKSL